MKAVSKVLTPSVVKGLKLFALAETAAMIFTGAFALPANTLSGLIISDAQAQVPEMPVAMVPVLVAITCATLFYFRKSMMASRA